MRYEVTLGTIRNGPEEVGDIGRFLGLAEGAGRRGGRVVAWLQSSACHPGGQLATVLTAVWEFEDGGRGMVGEKGEVKGGGVARK